MAGESKCPIYICALKKGFETCGSCHELVCKIWRETRDPRYDDEAFEKDIQERIRNLNHMHQ